MHRQIEQSSPTRTSAICQLVSENAARRQDVLSLVASENVLSPAAHYAGASDLNNRYTIPPSGERPPEIWDYPGQGIQRAIEKKTREAALELFSADYADVRPLSGNNAVMSVISALTRPGDVVMRVPPAYGGHFATEPIAQALQLNLADIPFDPEQGCVDIGRLRHAYRKRAPALVIFDSSMVLFPTPIREIREALGPDAIIPYDGSHTLGMIAGGVFANPLEEGADLLHGSTHKSLFGPQKGMILCRERGAISQRILETVVPLLASSVHSHHVAALGVALEELLLFGRDYASQVVSNARCLAGTLEAGGVRVYGAERGYTECHQLWAICGSAEDAYGAFERLERVGIFVNRIRVPFTGQFGLRLGLSELTRLGLLEEDARKVGALIIATLNREQSESSLAQQVRDMAGRLRTVRFSLPSPAAS